MKHGDNHTRFSFINWFNFHISISSFIQKPLKEKRDRSYWSIFPMWNCCCHHNRFSGNTPIAASKSKRGPLFENLYCYEVFSCHFSQPQFFVKFGPLWISQVVVKSRALNDAKFECGSDPRLSYVEALASVRARSRRVHSGPTLSVGCGMDFEIALIWRSAGKKRFFVA